MLLIDKLKDYIEISVVPAIVQKDFDVNIPFFRLYRSIVSTRCLLRH